MMQRISTIPFKNHIKWKISGHDGYQKILLQKSKRAKREQTLIGFDVEIHWF